ncbi:hypothetical protein [Streptomyces mayteni]
MASPATRFGSAVSPVHSPAASRASGYGAALWAALCVLLPVVGPACLADHLPSGLALPLFAVVACGGAVLAARRPLSERQALAALAGAQVAFHVGYTLPGAPGAVAPAGHGSGEALAGLAVAVLLAARLLGVVETLARPLGMALRAARGGLAAPRWAWAWAGARLPELRLVRAVGRSAVAVGRLAARRETGPGPPGRRPSPRPRLRAPADPRHSSFPPLLPSLSSLSFRPPRAALPS